jgi:drug/metabolite transporter (DMT)-like permease
LLPVVALILGVVFRDEVISPISIAGAGLVIVGAFLASRRETRAR